MAEEVLGVDGHWMIGIHYWGFPKLGLIGVLMIRESSDLRVYIRRLGIPCFRKPLRLVHTEHVQYARVHAV